MTKMAAMPIYGKNHKIIFFSGTGGPNFNETWYVTLGTLIHQCLYKSLPWVDLDLFYGKVNFGYIGFSMEKRENIEFFRNFVARDLKIDRYRQHVELMK